MARIYKEIFLKMYLKYSKRGLQWHHDGVTEALMKYERPKVKRDASQKCSLFLAFSEKKIAFLLGISFHFWLFVFH